MTDADFMRELDRLEPDWFITLANDQAMREALLMISQAPSCLSSELERLRTRTYRALGSRQRLYNAAQRRLQDTKAQNVSSCPVGTRANRYEPEAFSEPIMVGQDQPFNRGIERALDQLTST